MTKLFFTGKEIIEKIVAYINKNFKNHVTIEIMEIADLYHTVFNKDLYIEDNKQAEKALNEYGMTKAIRTVQKYEEDNWGEVYTDFSNFKEVAQRLLGILGERKMDYIGMYDHDRVTKNELLEMIELYA